MSDKLQAPAALITGIGSRTHSVAGWRMDARAAQDMGAGREHLAFGIELQSSNL